MFGKYNNKEKSIDAKDLSNINPVNDNENDNKDDENSENHVEKKKKNLESKIRVQKSKNENEICNNQSKRSHVRKTWLLFLLRYHTDAAKNEKRTRLKSVITEKVEAISLRSSSTSAKTGSTYGALSAMADQIVVVRVNGRPAGTAWCAPYAVDLPVEALKEKGNELEIDVTNSWRNRLIGDEQEPADCEFEKAPHVGGWFLRRYPDWFKDGIGARPSKGRKCFTTWNYFKKDSKLSPSGLIVPPELTWREK